MSHGTAHPRKPAGERSPLGESAVACTHPVLAPAAEAITLEICDLLKEAGCPLALPAQDRLRFETFLANLSATFVNVAANEVDSRIEAGLRQIVEFLDLDRSGLGEMSAEGMVITHSYQVPGVPPSPRVILEAQFPFFARKVQQGEVFRLPEDLPPEAVHEREFCARTGLRSNLTIPLKVTGAVVGGLGFASFRAQRDWPDELVQRLRLVGDIFTNALARKRAEVALQSANRQAQLLRDELAHATRLELISHLATAIAHEVNQPLCAIASNAQSAIDLLDLGDVAEAKNALGDIGSDARRGSEIIGRIRGMVKKDEARRAAIALAMLIEELAPLLHREAASKNVGLRIDLEAGNQAVVGDRVQLQQVVLNLLLNAVEAVSAASVGPPAVRLRAWAEDADWARIAVEDSGVGLSAAECERVFAPFFTTKARGLGMGLSISRHIVVAHGGSVWATPGSPHGTTFHIRLPAATMNHEP